MFANMDTDNSGTITYEELKTGLARIGSRLSEAEVKQLMEAVSCQLLHTLVKSTTSWTFVHSLYLELSVVFLMYNFSQADVDGNGSIDYLEFISATMHRHRLERDEHLYKAFQYFDKDNSGWVLQDWYLGDFHITISF